MVCTGVHVYTYMHVLACIYLCVDKDEDKEVVRMAEKREKISSCVLEIVLGHSFHLIFHLSLRIHLLSIL